MNSLLLLFCYTVSVMVREAYTSRKYNIEEESIKLYGESLQGVLARFRRSPDYLKILEDKMFELNEDFHEICYQVLAIHTVNYKEKAKEMLIGKKEEKQDGEKADKTLLLRIGYSNHVTPMAQWLGKPYFRQTNVENTPSPIERLDNYQSLHRHLTVKERNMFKDMAFEMAGKVFHDLFKHMIHVDNYVESTRIPNADNDDLSPTTEHKHEIMSTVGDLATTPGELSKSTLSDNNDKTLYRYKYAMSKSHSKG